MASSRSEENVNLKYFQHLVVSQCWCVLQFLGHFNLVYLADVIATVFTNIVVYGRCYCHKPYCGRCCTTRSDFITCCLLQCICCYHMVGMLTCCFNMLGRCYCHCFLVTDVIVTVYLMLMYWEMLCQVVMYHLFVIVAVGSLLPIADVVATFKSLYLADVIAKWLVLLPLYIQFMFWQMLLPRWLMECPPLGVVWQML